MFGRPPAQINVLPWARKTAEEFLIKGLKGCGVNYEDVEIDETISLLGTLPGWLNEYGFRRCIGGSHSEALSIVSTSAVQRAKRELENILKGDPLQGKSLESSPKGQNRGVSSFQQASPNHP